MRRVIISAIVSIVLVATAVPVWACSYSHHRQHGHHHGHHKHHHHGSHSSSSSDNNSGDSGTVHSGDAGSTGSSDDLPVTPTDDSMADQMTGATATTGAEKLVSFKITGFGKIDNTPRNSTTISFHCIHQEAGGTGTFADPLTAATPGHAGSTENPKCTKFYVPSIHRYVIIEDSGASKFDQPHLDVWSGTTDNVESCESKITKTEQIIANPSPNHPVPHPGPIATGSGCNI